MASQFQTQFSWYYFLLIVSLVLSIHVAHVEAANEPIVAKPGCNYTCGGVLIPFPFGIGRDCSYDHWFEIECIPNSNGSVKPFLSKLKVEVMHIGGLEFEYQLMVRMPPLNSCRADNHHQQQLPGIDLRTSPYSYDAFRNVFLMEGCPHSAFLLGQEKDDIMAGCGTVCQSDVPASGNCYGVHCCQASLLIVNVSSFQFYQIDFNSQSSGKPKNCAFATITSGIAYMENPLSGFPVILQWIMPKISSTSPLADCDGDRRCTCLSGSYGNPYLPNGCQVPEECKDCQFCDGEWNMTGYLEDPRSFFLC